MRRCDVCHRPGCTALACDKTRTRWFILVQIRAYRAGKLPLEWVRETVREARADMRGAA